ncbi:copper chaperone [Hydrotalea sp.]|uniref:heavy-metal-associated domain-containing protein n=1 Tax=Hydrotalea sp. TaxID=2881279 RepID=UPI002626EA03|nr:copper chaperone [Hydrotalea sp.]
MIKKMLLFFILGCITYHAQSQVMSAKPQWVTIKSDNLKCWQCKERLDKYLIIENNANMQKGMIQWKINLLAGEIRVQYVPDRVSVDDIKTALNNAGFDADDEKAEPDAYKKLPPVCKRAEDGGGPQKSKPCHIPPVQ